MNARWLVFALWLAAVCGSIAAPDPVFDVAAITAVPLNPKVLKSSEHDGLVTEEVMFHSEDDGAKSVDIFGILVYPKGAVKAPAFIWNQGGLAKASTYFPELGAKRGYATLCIDFPMPGYRSTGGYPIVSGLEVGDDPRQAPIYHGAVALLQAVTYLQSRPEVDPEHIGMAGSSWGGFYTTLMAGVDSRLKAASAMFGTGSLQLGNLWWDGTGISKKDDAAREHWRTTLDPALRLPASKVPIAWFTGTNDQFYWMPAVSRTYEMAGGPKYLSLFPNWNHALPAAGDEQVFAWLDTHLKGGPSFISVTPLTLEKTPQGTFARWKHDGPHEGFAAELILSYGDAGNWRQRCWTSLEADGGEEGDCKVLLPPSNHIYYISGTVLDGRGIRSSTPLRRISPDDFAPGLAPRVIDYDGASFWGYFSDGQVKDCARSGLRLPPITIVDAQTNDGVAELAGGTTTTLPPILYAPGIEHLLVLSLEAKPVPAKVLIRIAQVVKGQPPLVSGEWTIEVPVKPSGAMLSAPFTPLAVEGSQIELTITVPMGVSVQVEGVHFQPSHR
jgi:dienelactone hydrolase